jgi:hypothetical protein
MSGPGFQLADDLALPIDAVTQTFLILGMRGSGKTNTGVVLAEDMIGAGLPVCIIDPTGVWWGLRSSADGQGPGLPVTIIGGEHADLPLPAGSGALLADLVVDERLPVVLDLSLLSKTQQRRFATDFLERLYHRNREPLHLIVDEADLFAPQRATGEIARLLGAYEDIVRRGRAKGIGCTSITQRPAGMHTDVRSQAAVLIALRLIGRHDIVAIDDWVRLHASDEDARELKASLPSLRTGMAWVWSPEWLEVLQQIHVRPRRTFDSSATPKVGEKRIVPRAFARVDPADLERLAARLEPAEPAQEPAPKGRASGEVKRLRSELADVRAELAAERSRAPVRVEVPVLAAADAEAVREALATLDRVAGNLRAALGTKPPPPSPRLAVPPRPRPAPAGPPAVAAPPLKAGARRMLSVLARQNPLTVTRAQLASLAGMKRTGGTFQSYFSALRTGGFIAEEAGAVAITQAGLAAAGVEPGAAPVTAEEIREQWRSVLKAGARAMLDFLLEAHPGGMTRDELATAVGLERTGGTFQSYLSVLRSNGLAVVTGDEVRAADVFFLGAGTAGG